MGFLINLAAWVIFGALAGWVASLIMGTNSRQGCLMDIVVGIVGALIGGFVMSILSGGDFMVDPGFHPISFIVAVGGAVLLLFIMKLVRKPAS